MRKLFMGSLVLHVIKIGVVGGCMIGLLAGCSSKLQTTTASKKEMPKAPMAQVEPETVATVEEVAEVVVPQEIASQPIPESRTFVPAMDIPVEEPARPAPRPELSSEIFAKSKTPDEPMAISSLSEPVAPSTSQVESIAPSVPSSSDEEIPPTIFKPELPVQPTPEDQSSSVEEPLMIAKVMPQESEQVEITEEALEAALSDIYFDYDQFAIREEAGNLLKANAQVLSEKFAEAKIVVEGHCDERGTQSYNMVLGKRRAKAVKSFLQDLGVPEENLQVVSYGKEKPFCMEQTEACWQENRRGHFVIK